MPSKEPPADGSRAPRFEPLTRIATGGMAEIWLAREVGTAGFERVVVVKRLLAHLARERHIVEMFASEARFVARLVHPNVVQIHELGEDEEGYFLVMEYVAGCSVRELMGAARKQQERLPADIGVCIVEQACRGLHAAHELADPSGRPLGLVHRDVSPHNLMIGRDGDVKLLDFGIAKATEAADSTQTGSLKGKYGYMSPEQCRAQPLDRRSDIFAMGIVAWELLVGERLFDRGNEYDSLQAIVGGDVRPPSEACPDLSPAFDPVVMKALANQPDARWRTADELRRALSAAAEEAGLRPSRDALAAKLLELLGELLEERVHSIRSFASAPPGATRTGAPSPEPRPAADGSGGSGSRNDDAPTVVQRRAPALAAETGSSDAAPWTSADDTALETTRTLRDAPQPEPPVTEPSTRSPRRKVLALGAVFALVAGGLGIANQLGPRTPVASAPVSADAPALVGPPLRFAIAPTVDRSVMIAELEPFRQWLSRTLQRPVEVVVAGTYRESGELVASGAAQLGLLPPLLFVQTTARQPRVRPLALRLYDGSRGSDAYLLARDDIPVSGANDLRGRTVCLVDRESTTGFLLPRIWMRDGGLDPDKDVRTLLSGDHMSVLRDLSSRRCDAGAVYSGAYLSARQEGIEVGSTRVLAITGRAPQDVMAGAPDLPAAEANRIQQALIDFEPRRDIGAPRIGEILGISGFAPFSAAEFDRIRDAASKEGMLHPADAAP